MFALYIQEADYFKSSVALRKSSKPKFLHLYVSREIAVGTNRHSNCQNLGTYSKQFSIISLAFQLNLPEKNLYFCMFWRALLAIRYWTNLKFWLQPLTGHCCNNAELKKSQFLKCHDSQKIRWHCAKILKVIIIVINDKKNTPFISVQANGSSSIRFWSWYSVTYTDLLYVSTTTSSWWRYIYQLVYIKPNFMFNSSPLTLLLIYCWQ